MASPSPTRPFQKPPFWVYSTPDTGSSPALSPSPSTSAFSFTYEYDGTLSNSLPLPHQHPHQYPPPPPSFSPLPPIPSNPNLRRFTTPCLSQSSLFPPPLSLPPRRYPRRTASTPVLPPLPRLPPLSNRWSRMSVTAAAEAPSVWKAVHPPDSELEWELRRGSGVSLVDFGFGEKEKEKMKEKEKLKRWTRRRESLGWQRKSGAFEGEEARGKIWTSFSLVGETIETVGAERGRADWNGNGNGGREGVYLSSSCAERDTAAVLAKKKSKLSIVTSVDVDSQTEAGYEELVVFEDEDEDEEGRREGCEGAGGGGGVEKGCPRLDSLRSLGFGGWV